MHGLCTCTVDNPLAKAIVQAHKGLSTVQEGIIDRTGAQIMLYLLCACTMNNPIAF